MTPERLKQIEELFHSTLAQGPGERAGFLARACDGDEELRREVESLLEFHDPEESFIDRPAADVAAEVLSGGRTKLEAGRRIEHYELKGLLGEGGMGEVYLAEDTRLGRRVALKFLPARLTQDKEHLRRFEQEARAVAELSHPNVCTIHGVVETAEGRHCIVMEYVEGETLRERLAAGRMPVGEALDAAVQIGSALEAAHAAGVVHRDIKPENVVLRRDGYVKVLDFGLAKLTGEKSVPPGGESETWAMLHTSPGMVLGTVAYMSPEQARGLPVDARTDIWSLGVVLYEMLAGRQPFEGATPTDVIIAIAEREPAPLANLAPEAPGRLGRVVGQALAKDRGERYQTAEALLSDLKALRRGVEVEAETRRLGRAREAVGGRALTSKFLPPGSARARLLLLAALAGALVTAGLVYGLFVRPRPAPPAEIRSLAVLPLEDLSGDASQGYFADGMTEALITDLSKIGALRVMSRASVMRYEGARRALPEIGRELDVDAVLTGSVVRSGGRVRIAVQLTHAATDRNLWTNSYERDLRDVLALQGEVTRDIVREISIKLTPQEQVRFGGARPVNPEAYDHYLRGKYYLHRQSRENNESAIASLERAVAADPTFAAAHAELAQAYVWKLFLFTPGERQWAEKAFVSAEKALALNPDLAAAHLARGRLLWTPANNFPHEKAIREYRRALTLDPSLDEARNQLALVYNHVGAFDEALRELRTAVSINPSNNLAQYRIGETLLFRGDYEQALASLRSVPREVNPSLSGHQLAWALFNLGRKEEASAMLEQLLREHPEDSGGLFTSVQAVLAASAGQRRTAEEKIKAAVERGEGFGHFHHTAYHIACAYALMGESAQAVAWLEKAAEGGFPCYPLFERDSNLDGLRQDARFASLLAKLRREWEHYKTIL